MSKVAHLKIHSPNTETFEMIMKLVRESRGKGVTMTTDNNRHCPDRGCREIHATVKFETAEAAAAA